MTTARSQTQNEYSTIPLGAQEKPEITEFQMHLLASNRKSRCPDSTVLELSFD
jgi:hypothetical protein